MRVSNFPIKIYIIINKDTKKILNLDFFTKLKNKKQGSLDKYVASKKPPLIACPELFPGGFGVIIAKKHRLNKKLIIVINLIFLALFVLILFYLANMFDILKQIDCFLDYMLHIQLALRLYLLLIKFLSAHCLIVRSLLLQNNQDLI